MEATPQLTLAFPILLLLVAGIYLLFFSRLAPFKKGAGRQPRLRHPAIRITCAALALGIVITIGIGTWWATTYFYQTKRIEDATLVVPTKPIQPLAYKETDDGIKVEKARYLVDVLLIIQGNAGTRIHVEHFEVRWPEDMGKRFEQAVDFQNGHTFQYHFVPKGFVINKTKDANPQLFAESRFAVECRFAPLGSASGSGPIPTEWDGFRNPVTLRDGNNDSIISLVPRGSSDGVRVFTRFQRVEADDPLTQVSAAQHLTNLGHHIELGMDYGHVRGQVRDGLPAPIGLLAYGQFAFLLLLLAALFAAQCFRYRSLALAGALLVVVLYTAGLDAMVVRMHVNRATDPAATAEQKMLARSLVQQTFFWGVTARGVAPKRETVVEH